jgi:hypothetical protein
MDSRDIIPKLISKIMLMVPIAILILVPTPVSSKSEDQKIDPGPRPLSAVFVQ